MELIKRFFERHPKPAPGDPAGASTREIRVAACALFLEMCRIDGEFCESERENILAILKRDYGVPGDQVADLVAASREKLDNSVDLWWFTDRINRNFSEEEKLRVVETLWRLAYADGSLDAHEDYLVHKLARLLRLSHRQLIDAKLKAKAAT